MSDFGDQLRLLRKSRGLTLQHLAVSSQVSKSIISKIERGEVKPTVELAGRLADGLQTTLSDMLTYDCRPDNYHSKASERRIETGAGGQVVEYLSADEQAHRLVWLRQVCPAKSFLPGDETRTGAEVLVLVQTGGLDVILDDCRYEMYEGDSLFFDATCDYQFRNETNQPIEFLVAIKKPD